MRHTNWEAASYVAASGIVRADEAIPEADLAWLCGCGRSRPYATSKAYPICECGQRMRLLDFPKLGYAR